MLVLQDERLRTLAWMADYGDEIGAPLRLFDTKDHDISRASAVIISFVHRVDALFLQSKPWKTPGTYSHYVDHVLRKPILLHKSDGITSMGGKTLTPEMQARLSHRCAACVRSALEQLDSEFPDRDAVLAFQCFSLSPVPDMRECREALAILAKVFDLDQSALVEQFFDFRCFAIIAFTRLNVKDTFEAWMQSVQSQNSRADRVRAHPSDELRKLLFRFGAFLGASTGYVERCLGAVSKVVGPSRRRMSEDLQVVDAMLACNQLSPADEAEVLKAARSIYGEFYGPVRRREAEAKRWRSGLSQAPGRSSGGKKLESAAAWQSKRRDVLSKCLEGKQKRTLKDAMAAAAEQAGDAWTAKHENQSAKVAREKKRKEEDAALNEIKRRRAQGQHVPIPNHLAARNHNRQNLDKARLEQEAAGRRGSERPSPVAWRQHVTMVSVSSAKERGEIVRRLIGIGGRVTTNLSAATAFIVSDPSAANIGTVWRAALGGCPVASADFDDPERPVIHYGPAAETIAVDLWVSAQFKD